MNKNKLCIACHISGFDHTGWTVSGKPCFVCQSCGFKWTNGDGHPYFDHAQSHPKEIVILGWTKEDYDGYDVKLIDTMVIFERKK
jgi:hypothetical protein